MTSRDPTPNCVFYCVGHAAGCLRAHMAGNSDSLALGWRAAFWPEQRALLGLLEGEGGYRSKYFASRVGRLCKSPPQLGQVFWSFPVVQDSQNVHSKEQIIATRLSGPRPRSQHSHLSVIANIVTSELHSCSSTVWPRQYILLLFRQNSCIGSQLAPNRFYSLQRCIGIGCCWSGRSLCDGKPQQRSA